MAIEIDSEILSRVGVTPPMLLTMARTPRDSSVKREHIALALQKMEAGTSIIYTIEEFVKLFGKNGVAALRTFLIKKKGLKRAWVTFIENKVYIFMRAKA